jgi:hypothetical protein
MNKVKKVEETKAKELSRKLEGLQEVAIIHDKDGKEHKVITTFSPMWVLDTYTVPEGVHVAYTAFKDSGETPIEWREPEFRGSKGLLKTKLSVIRKAIVSGVFNPSSGYIFGLIHPDNQKEIDYYKKVGTHMDEVEIEGQKWIRSYIHVTEFMVDNKQDD